MDNGTKILKEILEKVKGLSGKEYLELYKEASKFKPIEIVMNRPRWKPEFGKFYYHINLELFSKFTIIRQNWTDASTDKGRFKQYNCFKTKKEATTKLKKIKEILRYA